MGDRNQFSLAEVCHNITDGKHGDCKPEPGSGYYFLSAKDVVDGKLNYVGAREITKEDFLESHKRTRLEADDILITNSGTIGRIAIIRESPLTSRSTFQKSVAIIKPKTEIVSSSYLYYYLTARKQSLLDSAGGTTQQNLLLKDLRSFKVRVPPIEEQKAIAKILSSLDDKIELNRRMNATLEAMARAVFKAWFVDFEPVHANKENRPSTSASPEIAKLFPSTFENGIPKGWKASTFGELITEENRRNRAANGLEVLSAVQTGELVKSAEYFNKQVFSSDTSRYKIVGPLNYAFNPSRINIGSIGLNTRGVDGLVSPVYVVFSVVDGYERWMRFHIQSDEVRNHINTLASGSVRQNLTFRDLSSIPLTIPPIEIVRGFESVMLPIREKAEVNLREIVTISEMRDSLLPRLVSGSIQLKI